MINVVLKYRIDIDCANAGIVWSHTTRNATVKMGNLLLISKDTVGLWL